MYMLNLVAPGPKLIVAKTENQQALKQYLSIRKNNKLKGYEFMAVHHGGKVGNAAGILANPKSTKQEKRKASQVLNEHKKKKH